MPNIQAMTARIAGLMTAEAAAADAVHHRGGTDPALLAVADATSNVPLRAAVPVAHAVTVTAQPAPAQGVASSGGRIMGVTGGAMTAARLPCRCPN